MNDFLLFFQKEVEIDKNNFFHFSRNNWKKQLVTALSTNDIVVNEKRCLK